jgi:hypothetical protein
MVGHIQAQAHHKMDTKNNFSSRRSVWRRSRGRMECFWLRFSTDCTCRWGNNIDAKWTGASTPTTASKLPPTTISHVTITITRKCQQLPYEGKSRLSREMFVIRTIRQMIYCIQKESISVGTTDQHCAPIIIPIFITQAPTCFGTYVPSSGSVLYPSGLLDIPKWLCCSHVL